MDAIHGRHPWISHGWHTTMRHSLINTAAPSDGIHGPWVPSRDAIANCRWDPWMASMGAIHGYCPWIINGSNAWMPSMDVRHGSAIHGSPLMQPMDVTVVVAWRKKKKKSNKKKDVAVE